MSAQAVVTAPVVVGVDGSEDALTAVDWAADAAEVRGRALRIVHAFEWAEMVLPHGPLSPPEIRASLRAQATGYLAAAVDRVRAVHPDLTVDTEVVDGAPAPVLLRESHTAALVVLGHRGLGGFTGLLVGSVGVQVSAHAASPTVVVRPHLLPLGDAAGTVVVGVDGSPDSDTALEFAFREASFREVGLTAVHSWRWPKATEPGDMMPLVYDVDLVHDEEQRVLVEALSGWQERFPDVKITHRLVRGRAGRALIDASAGAHLLVVGSRGYGGFTGLLLGSVSHAALHHADCPVAIVRN